MNVHNIQNPAAEAEVRELMMADKNILLAQRNAPIMGIVQDGLIGAYLMTHKDTKVKWMYFYDCVTKAEIELGPNGLDNFYIRACTYYPDYFENNKPNRKKENCPGRVLFSLALPQDFFYKRKNEADSNEPIVIIKNGILIQGIVDKSIIGIKANSIIHKLAVEYGTTIAAQFIDRANFIINLFLSQQGFSIGLGDCFCTDTSVIEDAIASAYTKCSTIIESGTSNIERKILTELNSVTAVGQRVSTKGGLARGKDNHIMACVKSGAKGNFINISQIAAGVGQQNVEGKRVPHIISGGQRSLPHFLCGDRSPEAGGFVKNNYVQGLNPQETFFHAMSGREGVIDTACRSVVRETAIVIIEIKESLHPKNKILEPKRVLIGEWIDSLMDKNTDINLFERKENSEHLKLKKQILIPTVDPKGFVTWGNIIEVTRHDPTDILYKVKTLSGRDVTVTDSHSLLIWDDKNLTFQEKAARDVVVGDYVPTTVILPDAHVILSEIDMSIYLPKSEYVYGTDLLIAVDMLTTLLTIQKRPPAGWWKMHNTKSFTLPHTAAHKIIRMMRRSNLINISKNHIYPYRGNRRNAFIPDKFKLDRKNGFMIGIYLADGDADLKNGHIRITNNSPTIQNIIYEWLDSLNIKRSTEEKIGKKGLSTMTRGYSTVLAAFFIKLCGTGAANKKVPSEAFIGPKDFNIGLLDGYFSGDGTVSKNSIEAVSVSKELIEGIQMICSKFGIFGKIATYDRKEPNFLPRTVLSIRAQWATRFMKLIKLTLPKKDFLATNCKPSKTHRNFLETLNDIVLDKIIKIDKDETTHSKVYDLTVPSTFNFGLANGLHVVDTADTGYIERKIGKKCEDCVLRDNGTVRDSSGHIIQFLYGGDGLDPSKLCYVKGEKDPFFIDVYRLAKRLNCDGYEPILLEKIKIKEITDYITIHGSRTKVTKIATKNIKRRLKNHLEKVKICPSIFTFFKYEILKTWCNIIACQGETVGMIATSSIGEPTTQTILNSVEWSEEIIIHTNSDGSKIVKIGEWIDDLLKTHKDKLKRFDENRTDYLDIDYQQIHIPSVSFKGKVDWHQISAVTRHLPIGKLVKITTLSGRTVTATQSKSFLIWNGEKLVQTPGKDIQIGDLVPITKYLKPIHKKKNDLLKSLILSKHYGKVFETTEDLDIMLDKIVKIEFVESDKKYVYDMTVPETTNFCMANGLGMADTFHLAGTEKETTLGVPRLVELLNVSHNPKTPSCTIYIKSSRKDKLERLIRKADIKLHLLKYIRDTGRIEQITCEDLLFEDPKMYYVEDKMPEISPVVKSLYNSNNLYRKFENNLWWYNYNPSSLTPQQWIIELKFDLNQLYSYKINLTTIAKILKDNSTITIDCITSPQALCTIIVIIDIDNVTKASEKLLEKETLVTYDNLPYFITRDIVIPTIKNTIIQGIDNIKKSFLRQENNEWIIDTQGSNLKELLAQSYIDETKTISDDMWEIYNTLGIEAARQFLIDEFIRILCFNGGYINIRHVELLVDTMTRRGTITSATRHGIERSVGPLAKGCFERSMENFMMAGLYGESDPNKGMSVRIAMGSPLLCGTGIVKTELAESYKEKIKKM